MAQKRIDAFFVNSQRKNDSDNNTNNTVENGGDSENSSDDESQSDKNERHAPRKKRKHEFQEKWTQTFKWLCKTEIGGMQCQTCIASSKTKNPFTEKNGCFNFRTSTLIRHQKSSCHQLALKEHSMRATFKQSSKNAFQIKNDSLLCAMRSAIWLVQENIASVKYASLMNFLSVQQCPGIKDLNCGKNVNYTSHTIAEELQEAVAETLKDDMKAELSKSNFCGILMDESTDISVSGNLVIFFKCVNFTDNKYEVNYHFGGNHKIKEKDAQTITDKVLEVLKEFNVSMDKVTCMGSDGASVMTGTKGGVVAKLRTENPKLLNIHCVAHRLALCTSQAATHVPEMESFRQILTNLFYYFKNSSVRTARLQSVQEILECPTVKVKEIHAVRWFSMFNAINAVYKTWDALVTYFAECQKDAKAVGLVKQITQIQFVELLYFLMDVIPVTTRLNLVFQKDNLDISEIQPAVKSVIDTLKAFQDGHLIGHYEAELQKSLVIEGKETKLFGHKLNKSQRFHESVKTKFVNSLIENIKQRFPEEDISIIGSFDVLTLKGLSCSENSMDYGVDKMRRLIEHFQLDEEIVLAEFSILKNLVLNQAYPTGNMLTLASILKLYHYETLPCICKLLEMALSLPVNTAICERGFSCQNLIKTSHRNRINDSTLNRLMFINIHCPSVSDSEQFLSVSHRALQKFVSEKTRKIFSQ